MLANMRENKILERKTKDESTVKYFHYPFMFNFKFSILYSCASSLNQQDVYIYTKPFADSMIFLLFFFQIVQCKVFSYWLLIDQYYTNT